MKVKSCPLFYWCSSPKRSHYPSWGNRRGVKSCCWDWDATIQFFSLCLLSLWVEWYESQWGSLSKYSIPHSHFHDAINEVGRPAFEPFWRRSCCFRATWFYLRQSWAGGAVWLTGDHLPTRWKSKAQKCHFSPVKKELCGWKWKLSGFYSWLLFFLSICLLAVEVNAVFICIVFSMINMYVSLVWNLQVSWRGR